MIEIQRTAEEEFTILSTISVARLLDRICRDPELYQALKTGIDEDGMSFAAFVVGTNALELEPKDLQRVYRKAHIGNYGTETEALEALLEHIGWQEKLSNLRTSIGEDNIADFLTWRSDALRERLAEQFWIVRSPADWSVFDADEINSAIDEA